MEIAGLRQRDGVSCGPTVAVVAGALLDPAYRDGLDVPDCFAAEQRRVHREVNWIWPRRLGTTPRGLARAVNRHSARPYRWRLFRGLLPCRRDSLADVLRAVRGGWPVPMLIGRFIPRHWVLIVEIRMEVLQCYEPSSGQLRSVDLAALRDGRLNGLGFPTPFAFALPRVGYPERHRPKV